MEDINLSENTVEKGVGKLPNSSLITVKPYFAAAASSTHDDAVPLPVELLKILFPFSSAFLSLQRGLIL